MKELPIIQNNESISTCSTCGGTCCKSYAGWYHPEQVLDILKEYKKSSSLPDNVKIDAYDASPDIYVLRPTHTNSPSGNYDLSWGGICVNHSDKGCSLTFDERPLQCQTLEVEKTFKCKGTSKFTMAEYWKEYQQYF